MLKQITEIKMFYASDNHRASVAEALEMAIEGRCRVMLTVAESGSGSVTLSVEAHDTVDILMLRLAEGFKASAEQLFPRYNHDISGLEAHIFLGRYGKYDLHADLDRGGHISVVARYGSGAFDRARHDPDGLDAQAVAYAWHQVFKRGLLLMSLEERM